MTTRVVTAPPEAEASEVARLLIENTISAIPVVDAGGNVLGMVSEGDLTGRNVAKSAEKSEWWLSLLAEGEDMAPEFLSEIRGQSYKARDLMSSPVISVNADMDIAEIARLLTEYHIKRVPVLEKGRMVGIVSRADLVRAIVMQSGQLAAEHPAQHATGNFFESLDRHFHTHLAHKESKPQPEKPKEKISAQEFHRLADDFHQANVNREKQEHERIAERQKKQVAELTSHHLDDTQWESLLNGAHEAAERGEKEFMMLRFPSELCADGGRAINVLENGWQDTLRGEPAEIFMRWNRELRPQGFHIAVRVLEYPGGFPGDIGLFLTWRQVV